MRPSVFQSGMCECGTYDVCLALKPPVLPICFLGGSSSVVTCSITSVWLQWPLSGDLAFWFFWQSHSFLKWEILAKAPSYRKGNSNCDLR